MLFFVVVAVVDFYIFYYEFQNNNLLFFINTKYETCFTFVNESDLKLYKEKDIEF